MLKARTTRRVLHQMRIWSASIAGGIFLLNGVAAAAIDFSRQRQFDIAPQTLPAALVEFSRQAGVQFTAHGMGFNEARTAGVKGEYAADTALGLLLRDTGFTFRIVDGSGGCSSERLAHRRRLERRQRARRSGRHISEERRATGPGSHCDLRVEW
jgi:hypothetical protein